jgi:hypothetical protein
MCCLYYAGYPKKFNWIMEDVVISFDSQGKINLRFFGRGQTSENQEHRESGLNAKA